MTNNQPTPPRLKDGLKQEEWENLQPELKEFYNDFSNTFGYSPVVTSGARTKTYKTKNSHHLTGNAMDLRYDPKLVNDLYNTKEGLSILTKYNLGMLDESTPEILEKTGGQGAHIHVGADRALVNQAKERLKSLGVEQEQTTNIPIQAPTDFQIYQGAETPSSTYDQFIQDLSKEKVKEEKVEKSDARQEIEEKKETLSREQEFLQAFTQATARRQEEPQRRQSSLERPELQPLPVNIQTSLPNLPTIFQEGGEMTDPPTKQQMYKATLDWLNANPYTVNNQPFTISGNLQPTVPTPGQYPRLTSNRLEVPTVGVYQEGEYTPVQMPQDYQGLPVYMVNGKYVVVDKEFNQEYLNFYTDKKMVGRDEIFPVYGKGTPYKPQP